MRKPVPSPGGTGSFHIFVFLLIIFPHFASSNVTVILVPLPGLLIDSNNLLGTVTHLYTLFFQFIHSIPIFTNRLNIVHLRKYNTSSFCT